MFIAQYIQQGNQLKPFKTNDPEKSIKNGCVGSICSALVDSKLYKCAKLFAIHHVLDTTNQIDDPDWQKYLDYSPIDLTNTTVEELSAFEQQQGRHIDKCDMCPSQRIINITHIPQTKNNIFPRT
jgi:hypothetical protein